MVTGLIIGATGLVGKSILANADKSSFFNQIYTIGRRECPGVSEKVQCLVEADTEKWPELIKTEAAESKIFFSGFGSTRASAGSADNFVEIDYGVNYECAKAAKEAGVETFVLISSGSANENSPFLYLKTKGQLEKDIIELRFQRTIILQPGALLGERETSRFFEGIMQKFMYVIRDTPLSFLGYPILGEDVGRIAVEIAEKSNVADEPIVEIISAKELTEMAKKFHE
uniref:NAD-dependent epimerase/dehydratase domain-containing protein n=1 Tax=Panagrolaimus sp. ES5 TaxID=591445 RepID=A0AC34FY37_9BILA